MTHTNAKLILVTPNYMLTWQHLAIPVETEADTLKFAVMSDLHLGHTGEGQWHNRALYDQAENIMLTVVTALNKETLDVVFILVDITQNGDSVQLTLAHTIISELKLPWFVLPGNHDRSSVRLGTFENTFHGCLLPEFSIHNNVAFVAIYEDNTVIYRKSGAYLYNEKRVDMILDQIERFRPEMLFVFSHQHWHKVLKELDWCQCTTASLIEYPMEARIISWDGRCLSTCILPIASELAAISLDTAPWVHGRESDREWTYSS